MHSILMTHCASPVSGVASCRLPPRQVTTEKMIRKQLEDELGRDVGEHKALIRKHVLYVVQNLADRQTLAPLADDGDGAPQPSSKGGDAAAAGARGKEQPHVLVVGAGPAGLAAATVLQVRLGGRPGWAGQRQGWGGQEPQTQARRGRGAVR